MASSRHPIRFNFSYCNTHLLLVKIPKPSLAEHEEKSGQNSETPLPQTLVRIPIETQSEVLQSQNGTGKNDEG